MRYPEGLVEEYGAKAGILMYVAQELPDIPQAPMVASKKGESAKEFLNRVGQLKFGPPWLVRSSAVAELGGYEGEFLTLGCSDNWRLKSAVERVQDSPQTLKEKGYGQELPDQISAIIAKKIHSKYIGTYIKHPNVPDFYLLSLIQTEANPFCGALRFAYSYRPSEGVKLLKSFINDIYIDDAPVFGLEKAVSTVISWHDQIAALPKMDPSWAYQIEFGLPPCLFQVRPFKPLEQASFTLPEDDSVVNKPIVIGITASEGIRVKVRRLREEEVVASLGRVGPFLEDSEPVVVIDSLRDAKLAKQRPNLQANLLQHSQGLLQHGDISAIRRAIVTALYPADFYISGGSNQGDWLRIISDGRNIDVHNVNSEMGIKG